MSRRLWPSALLMLAGCQVLPTQSIDCAVSGRCTPVSFVLGQPDATQNGNLRAGINQPLDTLVIAGKLFVADCRNNRVLIWKTVPIFNNQPADYVLGQPDFNTNLASYGGVSARSMSCPGSLAFGVDKKLGKPHLIVGDRGNGRVLIWNSIPDASYVPADVVVGQTEVTSGGANNRPTATMLTDPSVTVSDDGKLIVADQMNSRVPNGNYTSPIGTHIAWRRRGHQSCAGRPIATGS